MTSLEIRLAGYAFLLVALCTWGLYERHHLIAEGKAQVEAADNAARTAQEAKDAAINGEVVGRLKSDNEALRAAAMQPAASIVCRPKVRYVSATSPGGTVSIAGPNTPGTGPGAVSQGDGSVDIGPWMSDIAWAADVLSERRDLLAAWAVAQATTR